VDAFTFLSQPRTSAQPVYVLAGPERFLKQECLRRICQMVLGGQDRELAMTVYEGSQASLAEVRSDLAMVPIWSPRRLVLVRDADAFVSTHRAALEEDIRRPSPHGTLVLEVQSWRSDTRLARMLPPEAVLECAVPPYEAGQRRLLSWLEQRSQEEYGKRLAGDAARLLLDLVGPDLGILDRELAKLAAAVGDAQAIAAEDVDRLVASGRQREIWALFDLLAQGNRSQALRLLHQVLDQGEEPIALLAALSWQLRRLVQVYRLRHKGVLLPEAARRLGLRRPDQAERLLRQLGPRTDRLYDWLVEADRRLKSSHDLPPRTVLERLVVRLCA
jgi:DNA polymerase-3 subunit delta